MLLENERTGECSPTSKQDSIKKKFKYKLTDYDCKYCLHRVQSENKKCGYRVCPEVIEAANDGRLCDEIAKHLKFAKVLTTYGRTDFSTKFSEYLELKNRRQKFLNTKEV